MREVATNDRAADHLVIMTVLASQTWSMDKRQLINLIESAAVESVLIPRDRYFAADTATPSQNASQKEFGRAGRDTDLTDDRKI